MDRAGNLSDKQRTALTCLLLGGLTLVAFWPVAGCDFVNYDDEEYVTQNPPVCAGVTLRGLAWALSTGWSANWHPLTWLSHMIDCQVYGLHPPGHHLTNLAFHLANVVLLFLLLKRLTRAQWRSAIVAALFAVHPLHVQSVAWVSERKDVLSGLFFLLMLWGYVRGHESGDRSQEPGVRKGVINNLWSVISNQWLALAFFALGLMSKPMLVTAPFVLLLLDYWPLKRITTLPPQLPAKGHASRITHHASFTCVVVEKVPFFILSAASGVITVLVQQRSGAVASWGIFSFGDRVANAFVSYVRYLGKLFWPADLAVFYPHPSSWAAWQVGGAIMVLATITAFAIALRRRFGFLITGWFWFTGMLLPVIGLVQVGEQAMADRYTYLPSIGFFIALVWGVAELLERSRFAVHSAQFKLRLLGTSVVVLLITCAALSNVETRYWSSSETLFTYALRVTNKNAIAHFGLAKALCQKGSIREGEDQLRAALALEPGFAKARGQLAYALCEQQKFEEGIQQYQQTLQTAPDQLEALNNLAWIYATHPDAKFRNGAEAVNLAERACALSHNEKTIFMGTLAAAYAEAGRFPEAVAQAEQARNHALAWKEIELAQKNEQLLELYRTGKPFREAITVSRN